MSIRTTTTLPESVETFRLPTILATLPIHIFTAVFITIVMVSILLTRHLQPRPRTLLAINCGFFVVASFYDLAFDISYLSIVDRQQISVQECSAIRNFVYNPIATQAFVDALERFLMAFFNYDMPISMSVFPSFQRTHEHSGRDPERLLKSSVPQDTAFSFCNLIRTVFILYCLFPLFCVAMAIYNTFISSSLLQTDDICSTVRRTSWTNIALILIQWGSAIVASILYVAIWSKVRHQRKVEITSTSNTEHDPAK
ncbi:hypothetical protein OSTOST_21056, partial [Ostertagia ostertagi]